MSKRNNHLLLEDMFEASSKILRYSGELTFDQFLNDDKTIDAVVRNFEIIGEASNRVDPDFKILHPEIEWTKLKGFRNRLIHEYFGVDYAIVWEIIQEDIDPLLDFLTAILKK